MDPNAFGGLRPLVGRAGYIKAYIVGDKKLGKERIVGRSILAKENGDQQFSIPVSFHPLSVRSLQGPRNLLGHLGGRGGQPCVRCIDIHFKDYCSTLSSFFRIFRNL
jgi:hypothetical protein